MKFGISTFPTEYGMRPGELARAVEERGFESFWIPEHSHLPVCELTPGPGLASEQAGFDVAKMYYHMLDPFAVLGMAAEATERILLGTSICLLVQRDPIHTAKAVATLDVLSEGRFQFGVGGGWHPLEMANHGADYNGRLELMRERIEAMKAIWTEEKAEYHGKRVNFDPIFAWPKPVQRPHPPIHVAASPPGGLRRVIRYGDGWMPSHGDDVIAYLPALRQQAEAAGREPGAIEVSVYWVEPEEEAIRRYAEAGIDRVIFVIDPEPRDATLAALDAIAKLTSLARRL